MVSSVLGSVPQHTPHSVTSVPPSSVTSPPAVAVVMAMSATSAVVTAGSMDVYSDKNMTRLIGSLKQYTVVQVNSYSNGVAGISFHGVDGYAAAADMDKVSTFGKRAVTIAASRIYSSPDRDSQSVILAKGTRLYVLLPLPPRRLSP